MKKNDLKRKNNLKILKTIIWIWILGAFTMTIFFPAKLFFEPNEPINYYVLAILSGLTGSVWGVIINELARDWRTESLISDIYKDKNQSKRYMKKMIIIGIITLIYIFLLSFFIDYFKVG